MERPSKYHRYTGDGYTWDSTHPELEPTSTFTIGYSQNFCSYCCSKAYPIQAGLKGKTYLDHRDYSVTGYCCICEGAEKEKELKIRLKELQNKHDQEMLQLKKEYIPYMKQDKEKRIIIEQKYKLKDVRNDEWDVIRDINEVLKEWS